MGLLDRVIEARRAPARSWPVGKGSVATTDLAWGHDLSEFAPDTEYGDYLATSNDIYAVAHSRARLVTAARLRFYQGSDSEKKDAAGSRAAQLYRRVNEHWTAERLERMDELSMCIWGHTAWAIEPAARGEPDQVWWLKPSRLKPVPHETDYLAGFLYEPLFGEPPIAFNADEIVWFRYPNPLDEFAPLSPLAAARLAADTATAMNKANKKLFENGLMAGGIIVPTDDRVVFESNQAEDLERQFAVRMKGAENAHRWAVLRYAAKVQGLNISPKDAEFVAGLNLTFRQVCRAYGMQPALAGDLEHATLANATVFERVEWSRTLVPDLNLRASEVREQYLPRFKGEPDHCEYDYSKIPALQEAASEIWTRQAQALDRGLFTINEVRAELGRPPVEWGDKPYMPVNKAQPDESGVLQPPASGKLPDDEVNPSTKPASPRELVEGDHHAARRLLASIQWPINGARV